MQRRTTLGPRHSAALPLLWAEMRKRDWTAADLARALNEPTSTISRLLYADRKPERSLAGKLQELGIPLARWDEPLPSGWSLEAAQRRAPVGLRRAAAAAE